MHENMLHAHFPDMPQCHVCHLLRAAQVNKHCFVSIGKIANAAYYTMTQSPMHTIVGYHNV